MQSSAVRWLVVFAMVGIIVACVAGLSDNTRPSTRAVAQRAPDPAEEAAFQKALLMARAVKAGANDPASIDVFEAFQMTDGTTVIKYRGRNAFNGTIVNVAIVTPDGKSVHGTERDVAKTWNKYVANKTPRYELSSAIRGAKHLVAY